MLIVNNYDYGRLKAYFEREAAAASGATWSEVAQKLSRIGKWEFEDYRRAASD